MQHLEELRNKATEIATETQAGANTASRIGTAFTSVVDTIDELVNSNEDVLQVDVKQSEKISTLETSLNALKEQLNGVNSELITSLRDGLTSETTNRTQSISSLDSKLTTLQGKLTEETSARQTAVSDVSSSLDTVVSNITQSSSGVNSSIETLRNSISTEASTRENAVNTINTAITELKNKKVIAEEVTTTENGDTKELTLQAGKVYMLSENVDKLRIKAIAPPENTKEVAEVMLYFHTGQNGDSGVVARSGDAPMISFEGVALSKDMTIEKNMFYEISFKYNPIARKYTALVASWTIA